MSLLTIDILSENVIKWSFYKYPNISIFLVYILFKNNNNNLSRDFIDVHENISGRGKKNSYGVKCDKCQGKTEIKMMSKKNQTNPDIPKFCYLLLKCLILVLLFHSRGFYHLIYHPQ